VAVDGADDLHGVEAGEDHERPGEEERFTAPIIAFL
jgi:hypothetical protein